MRKAVIKTKGGSGPSAIDADGWRRILCSNNFGDAKVDLRKVIANFIKKVCTEKMSAVSIEPFVTCRLIPLEKKPGFQPIEVEEILCRITGKSLRQYLRRKLLLQLGHSNYMQGKRLDSKQL